ncbi:tyrosine--tRNA ligase [Candidatus Kaiserbacteria bacterium]|nr:tyrosine--tRNA ligase [Candidatus Kaiserbacteria bacterium]
MSLAQELINRGFINQFSAATLEEIVDGEKRTIYHGIDPSADSAHAGNFVIWMLLRHLADAGHKIVFLVGGGTGMIGDPKPDSERQLKDASLVNENVIKLKTQAEKLFSGYDFEFVNNYDWLKEVKLIDFLRDIGKHYTVNELIKKDAIANRLQSDNGLSYTEFAYPLLQGYDYLELFKNKNCTVQVGGSDQWGNIISGVELVRRKEQAEVFAITVPLIIDKATGKKFGKSEGNAVWIDGEKTSPYQFYQFWLNVSDDSVIDYLKLFTLLTLSEIEEVKKDFELNPGNRSAQKRLAFEVTKIVHGEENTLAAEKVSELLFGGNEKLALNDDEYKVLVENAPSQKVAEGLGIIDVLVESELATSKREARTFVESGAVTLNGVKVDSVESKLDKDYFKNNFALLRRGKKKYSVILLED